MKKCNNDINHFFLFFYLQSKICLSQSLYPLLHRAGSKNTDNTFQIKLILNIHSKKVPNILQLPGDFQYRRQTRPSLNNSPHEVYRTWALGSQHHLLHATGTFLLCVLGKVVLGFVIIGKTASGYESLKFKY